MYITSCRKFSLINKQITSLALFLKPENANKQTKRNKQTGKTQPPKKGGFGNLP